MKLRIIEICDIQENQDDTDTTPLPDRGRCHYCDSKRNRKTRYCEKCVSPRLPGNSQRLLENSWESPDFPEIPTDYPGFSIFMILTGEFQARSTTFEPEFEPHSQRL
ncbi:hypothetical protein PPYR_02317 [Photinus pyralis]|uniref:Uncharacterized protein n=1 Tax=Photinus pyralis TaxID=7054 RepID=A0A5N4B6W7_PHOPY|nr:hypothetical protein PPYR_02317 [Photinus pyralis]